MSFPFHEIRLVRRPALNVRARAPMFSALRKGRPTDGAPERTERPRSWDGESQASEVEAAELCKLYLRLKHEDRLARVEEFIQEVEGALPEGGGAIWERFIDLNSITDEVMKPLDVAFKTWSRI
jgi:hypothetical protein